MESLTKYVNIGNGIVLPYVEQGDADGIPAIFLHGVTDSHRSFELVLEALPSSIRAIAVTQRGHGEAPRLESGYGPRDYAGDLAGFMAALNVEKAVIIGHSMGSFAAQRFAIDHPQRVAGLLLIGSFKTCKYNAGVIEFVDTAIEGLTDPIPPEAAREFQASTINGPVEPDFFEMAVKESLKVPARIWKAACRAMIDEDHTQELSKIEAETLLLWGQNDGFFSIDEQEDLLKLIPNSSLTIYPGVGHAPHWEDPERTAVDITKFVFGLPKFGVQDEFTVPNASAIVGSEIAAN